MTIKKTIESQYYASLEMLKQAIVECPNSLWAGSEYKNEFWHIAYHVLFYAHLYLQPTEEDFAPWEKHKNQYRVLESSSEEPELSEPLSKEELLEYLAFCHQQVEEIVSILNLSAESGFYWLPFDKLELQFYNIRHLQQHTGELCERLGATGDIEIGWVGRKPD